MNSTPDGGPGDAMSPGPIVMYENAGRWSATTSVGLLAFQCSKIELEKLLRESGIVTPLVSVDPLTWQSTWRSALSQEILSLDERLENLPQSSEVSELRERQDAIAAGVDRLSAEIKAERRRTAIREEIATLEADLESRRWIVKQGLGVNATDAEVQTCLNMTPIAKRIRELRGQL